MTIGNVEWPTGEPRRLEYKAVPPSFNPRYTSERIAESIQSRQVSYNPNIDSSPGRDLYTRRLQDYS